MQYRPTARADLCVVLESFVQAHRLPGLMRLFPRHAVGYGKERCRRLRPCPLLQCLRTSRLRGLGRIGRNLRDVKQVVPSIAERESICRPECKSFRRSRQFKTGSPLGDDTRPGTPTGGPMVTKQRARSNCRRSALEGWCVYAS